jgi:hypothetical protein
MQEVVTILEAIISSEQNDVIIYDNYEKKELEEYKSNSILSKGTIDLNNDLMNNVSSLNFDECGSGIIVAPGNSSGISNQETEPLSYYCFYYLLNMVN